MPSCLLRCVRPVLLLLIAMGATGYAWQARDEWAPGVKQVLDASPALSPDGALKTFFLPPGYRIELVASEPLVNSPVAIDFDPEGRMWVVEMNMYMPDFTAADERAPLCRVVVLEDTNNDGRMDKRTVFMDGLVLPRAVKVLDRGVLVAEPPNLWFARDTNGDLVSDTRELVTDTYGPKTGYVNVEHNANGLHWAMDNRIYTAEHDSYFRLKNGKFTVEKTIYRGQWGLTHDDAGRIYRNTNGAPIFVDLIPAPYFVRNANLLRSRGAYEALNNAEVNATYPIRPTPGIQGGFQANALRPDGTLPRYTAAGTPTVFRGDRLPRELYGNVFVTEPVGNLVSRILVSDDGNTLRASRAYAKAEFLTSTDERFRPVNLASAPDGTLYVVDMYRGIIQHRDYVSQYLKDHIDKYGLEQPTDRGRIYRVVHESMRPGPRPALSAATPAQLVQALSHPNGWWRDTAQRLLVERGNTTAVAALVAAAQTAPDWRTRLHALWTLDGLDALEAAVVTRALNDQSREVRTAAVRLSERWLAEPAHPIRAEVLEKIDDPDWNVRQQLAATLGELDRAARVNALATMIERHGDDPVVMDAAISGAAGLEPQVLARLLENPAETAERSAGVTMLAATIVQSRADGPIQQVLDQIADGTRPQWQRSALMHGVEVTMLGETMPGSPGGRGGAGRGAGRAGGAAAAGRAGGDGGGGQAEPLSWGRGAAAASAFPDGFLAQKSRRADNLLIESFASGRSPGMISLELKREPGLVKLAAGDGELGMRATWVLGRLFWPGKPGVSPEAAPLTAEEQRQFTAGRLVYEGVCLGCHQADGRGRDGVAPPMVGSSVVLGPADIAARVIIHGKSGTMGLMPPMGALLNDEKVAAVLTYMRRNWGQTGSPVDEEVVREVRTAYADRKTPWTSAELERLQPTSR